MFIKIVLLTFLCLFKLFSAQRIVIVGGGVSGLAAANELIKAGFNNLTIIEGEKFLGGRIRTISFNRSFIELGAQWIHGVNRHPIYRLMNSINEIDTSSVFFRDGRRYQATQDGKMINESFANFVSESAENIFSEVYEDIESIQWNSQKSLGTYLDQLYPDFLSELTSKYGKFNRPLADSIYNSVLQDEKSDYACDSYYELTAAGVNEIKSFGGNQYVNLKNGYVKLINLLKSNIKSTSIKFNQLVTSINWSNKNEVVISAVDSSSQKVNEYKADAVLVTSSLGYLKQNYKSMFNPSLPAEKANAIEKIGFGTVNKIFVIYDRSVLKSTDQGLQLFWRSDLPIGLPNVDSKCNLQNNRFYKSFSSFDIPPRNKNVLFGFLTGQDSINSESVSDECFIDVIYELFKKFYPTLNLPRPNRIIRSKWNSDKLAKGSYSYLKVGSTPSDIENLSAPIENRIFFSGEATNAKYIASVHGAYLNGVSAAKSISQMFDDE